jgi:hypothetical protein
MTLRAYLITMRGRIREALVPELQVLRDNHATLLDNASIEVRRLRAEALKLEAERDESRAYREAYFKLLKMVSEVKAMEPGCPVFLATPPQDSIDARRPLTDEEIDKLPWCPSYENPMTLAEGLRYFARAIERAHKIGGNDE